MKIRFQADENLNEDIVTGVLRRAPEIDFEFADHAGLYKLSDLEVLAIAARDERILITHDLRSILSTSPGLSKPGPALEYSSFPKSQRRSRHRRVDSVWTLSEAGDYENSIRILRL